MLEFGHLLVAIADPATTHSPAVARAAGIARRTGARITLFHSLYSPHVAGEQFYDPDALQRDIETAVNVRRAALERIAQPLRDAGLAVHVRVRWDYPVHESIVREVLRAKIDVLVVDSHPHAPTARLVLTNTDWQLIRLCPCPVLLAKTTRPYDRPRVLAAVDPMHAHAKPHGLDALLLATGGAFADAFDGRLHAAHFYTLATPFTAGLGVEAVPMPIDVADLHRKEVKAAVARLVADHGLAAERVHLRAGLPVEELPALATELDAHLVVMGAVSRSTLRRLFIGHTAERVLDRLHCDVLVVKPAGFRTPVPTRTTRRPAMPPPF